MKRVVVLGSSGSIGRQTIDVCKRLGLNVVGLAVNTNIATLREQITQCTPLHVAVADPEKASALKRDVDCEVLSGSEGVRALAHHCGADIVVAAMSGTRGVEPVFSALSQGIDVALANKETLVSAGEILLPLARRTGARIIPLDSEHSAIFQCLQGENLSDVEKIIVTASGGPFLHYSEEKLKEVTLASALKHPNWTMGVKNTIDSSTLMNKGLEVIEAMHLFEMPVERIEVLIHPQSIIHSMVAFRDTSVKAQLSGHDMQLPIQYALTYPERKPIPTPMLNFADLHKLEFYAPDIARFPCLGLALEAAQQGGTLACFMNASNEVLVERFVEKQITWSEIGRQLERLMQQHTTQTIENIEHVLAVDEEARRLARSGI